VTIQKQSQTNPIQTQFLLTVRGTKPNQTQSKPTCGEQSRTICSELVEPILTILTSFYKQLETDDQRLIKGFVLEEISF
jgi:hypothetical protein